MFARATNDYKINKTITVALQQNHLNKEQGRYLRLLLSTLRTAPATIIEKKSEPITKQYTCKHLTNDVYKLQKALHKNSNEKKDYIISYLVPLDIHKQSYCEIKLLQPLKLHKTAFFPSQSGDAYLVVEEYLGCGGFARVKAGNTIYWYDSNNNLHYDKLDQSLAIKTFCPEKIKDFYKTSDETVEEIINLEYETSKQFLDGHISLLKYSKKDDVKRFDLVMPKFAMDLDKYIANGEAGKLSYSKRFQLLADILSEIERFHLQTNKIHHDVKPNNIMLDPKTLAVKLIDFGCANKHNNKWNLRGTASYCDPRLIKGEKTHSSPDNDYYSFALVALLILLAPNQKRSPIHHLIETLELDVATEPKDRKKNLEELLTKQYFIDCENLAIFLDDLLNGKYLSFQTIENQIREFLQVYQYFEKIKIVSPTLTPLQKYSFVKMQLLATCNELNDVNQRDQVCKIIHEADAILAKEGDSTLPTLTEGLQKTNNFLHDTKNNISDYHDYTKKLSPFPWSSFLKDLMLSLLVIGIACVTVTSFFLSLACYPATFFCLVPLPHVAASLGPALIGNSMIGSVTSILGVAMSSTLFNIKLPFKKMQNEMHELEKDVQHKLRP